MGVADLATRPLKDALARVPHVVRREMARAEPLLETGTLLDAMLYALEGGKGLRGFLVLEGARLHGLSEGRSGAIAAAVECIHAYSLVHDDLPCMDDDDLRRGRPTVHKRWSDAVAVLAGDGLQALAFSLVSQSTAPPKRVLSLIQGLARAAGPAGMVLGQAQDIAAESAPRQLTLEEITALQARKTGALIRWAATAGPIMAGADPDPLEAYGRALGLAFQISDDVLDVEGDAAAMGKAVRKDEGRGKATFVSLLGLAAAKARAEMLVEEACDALSPYGGAAETLRDAARYVTARRA